MTTLRGDVESDCMMAIYGVVGLPNPTDFRYTYEVYVWDGYDTRIPVSEGGMTLEDSQLVRSALEMAHTPEPCEYCGSISEEPGYECACMDEVIYDGDDWWPED